MMRLKNCPSSWPIEADLDKYPEGADQYGAIVLRLTQLSEERKNVRSRVEKPRRVRDAVQPLSATTREVFGII
jgi:hypothetical protein